MTSTSINASSTTTTSKHNHHHHHTKKNPKPPSNSPNSSSITSTSISTTSHRPPSSQPNTACAACKYQRRRCLADCILAPFFPADHQQKFLNAHRLFGVSNIMKIIKEMDPVQRRDAMNTIIYQSDMRYQDPVGGCYRYIRELERQIELVSTELSYVMQQLDFYRAQATATGAGIPPADINVNLILNAGEDDLIDGTIYNTTDVDVVSSFKAQQQQQQQEQEEQYYSYICEGLNDNHVGVDVDGIDGYHCEEGDGGSEALQLPSSSPPPAQSSSLNLQQRYCELSLEEEDKPVMDILDLRLVGDHNIIEEEELNLPDIASNIHPASLNCSQNVDHVKEEKDELEHVQEEGDLKEAASLFSLTNY